MRFELVRRGRFRARLLPPPALRVDPSAALREALVTLLPHGSTEFEFAGAAAPGGVEPGGRERPPLILLDEEGVGVVN